MRLHHKHGLNPTIPTCARCGKDKHEIVLLGAAYKNEAPMHMVLDHEPCDQCQAVMARGITLIEATQDAYGTPHMTGRWAVITHDAAEHAFTEPMLSSVQKHGKAYIAPEAWDALGLTRES